MAETRWVTERQYPENVIAEAAFETIRRQDPMRFGTWKIAQEIAAEAARRLDLHEEDR